MLGTAINWCILSQLCVSVSVGTVVIWVHVQHCCKLVYVDTAVNKCTSSTVVGSVCRHSCE